MPAEVIPRQKKHASKPVSSCAIEAYSCRSLWTRSRSFGLLTPVALRPIATTRVTSAARRHSRSTPCPTMPVAPKINTCMRVLFCDALAAAHVRPQRRRDRDRSVLLLEVLEDRDQRAADREPR